MSHYASVFFECIWKASIVPFGNDATYFAMKEFGGYDMTPALLLAVAGATLGQMFNWGVGNLLGRHYPKLNVSKERYSRVAKLFNTYGIFLLLFCWAPLCNFLVVLASFTRTKPKFMLPLVIIGSAAHYGLALM